MIEKDTKRERIAFYDNMMKKLKSDGRSFISIKDLSLILWKTTGYFYELLDAWKIDWIKVAWRFMVNVKSLIDCYWRKIDKIKLKNRFQEEKNRKISWQTKKND